MISGWNHDCLTFSFAIWISTADEASDKAGGLVKYTAEDVVALAEDAALSLVRSRPELYITLLAIYCISTRGNIS